MVRRGSPVRVRKRALQRPRKTALLPSVALAQSTALESPTTLRAGALEAIDGTPIIDLKVAMREAPEA
jgi:tRNA (Thr-GGU) A37 N-methylase